MIDLELITKFGEIMILQDTKQFVEDVELGFSDR